MTMNNNLDPFIDLTSQTCKCCPSCICSMWYILTIYCMISNELHFCAKVALIWMLLLLTGGVYFEVSARENHEGVHAAFLHLCQEVGLCFCWYLLVQNIRISLSYRCIPSPTTYVGLSAFCENGFHFPLMPINTENTEKPCVGPERITKSP